MLTPTSWGVGGWGRDRGRALMRRERPRFYSIHDNAKYEIKHEVVENLYREPGSADALGAGVGATALPSICLTSRPLPLRSIAVSKSHGSFGALGDKVHCSKNLYSITSSASATKLSGKAIPVAFAVLRLMTSL